MFPFFPVPSASDPFNFVRVSSEIITLSVEAQSVIMYRMLGMSGLWSVNSDENERMVSEKHQAFSQSITSAMNAAMAGSSPDKVISAAIKPLRSKTSSNVKRLSKRGPTLGLS